jgi:hypothetical protein
MDTQRTVKHVLCCTAVLQNMKTRTVTDGQGKQRKTEIKKKCITSVDCLCVLVVRVPGYTSRGLGFDSLRYQIF